MKRYCHVNVMLGLSRKNPLAYVWAMIVVKVKLIE